MDALIHSWHVKYEVWIQILDMQFAGFTKLSFWNSVYVFIKKFIVLIMHLLIVM